MSKSYQPFYVLHGASSSLVIDCRENAASILYWGPRLGQETSPEMLALLKIRQEAKGCTEKDAPIALSPEYGAGFIGNAGIQAHHSGRGWGVFSQIQSIVFVDESNQLVITSSCEASSIEIVHSLAIDPKSGVLTATTKITNLGDTLLDVDQCNAPTIPIPLHCDKILGFEGRWASEFQLRNVDRFIGTYLRENRAGRTSHDTFPGVVIHAEKTNESVGEAFGLHLGWSGNHRIRIEEQSVGRAYAQLGELFYPGELRLAPGESYCSPTLYGAHSDNGFSGLSRCFHSYVRSHLTDLRVAEKSKPVHFNTWEAMYFDLEFGHLCELADKAAEVGVERFVLDDGWFKNRNSDNAALGDWFVDEAVFPNGLTPLIDYVNDAGMEFGLWIEPEMVNPDSDLYRAYPEWILRVPHAPLVMSRNQMVLDLTRDEVQEYLFERLDSLLSDNAIAYLKWDMNRDLNQPGDSEGRAVAHYQTLAVYRLLERIRRAHPKVEIESCSSGGGRADFGILRYTDRIWTSDTNDAIDRLRIQKGFSFFFPPEVMGAHVGPSDCHTTGRTISMATRATVAMFGDMGIEANLLEMPCDEFSELKSAVALHKKHRKLIFSGDLMRLDLPSYESGFGITSEDKKEALFSYALIDSQPHSAPGAFRFDGITRESLYEVNIIWPSTPYYYSEGILDAINGAILSGDALMTVGMQLPIMLPQTMLIFHLKAVE